MSTSSHDLVWRGSVVAHGLLLLGDEARLRALVLAEWAPGSRVHRTRGGLALVWGSPRRVRGEHAPGLPLVLRGGALVAGPAEQLATAAVAARARVAVYAFHGAVVAEPLDASSELDPAGWLTLDSLEVLELRPLPVVRPAATSVISPPPTETRALLGADVPPTSKASSELLAALHAHGEAGSAARAAAPLAARVFGAVAGLLQRFTRRTGSESGAAGTGSARQPRNEALATRTGPLLRLRAWLSGVIWRSRFAALFGAAHTRHLREMLQMFERGQLDEALRHAIPLAGPRDTSSLPLALRAPGARTELELSMTGTRAQTVTPLSGVFGFEMTLRAHYQRAFNALRDAGQVEKAAFVLVELLQDITGAIAYLERAGRFDLAARLAEGRELPPATQVRLWALAGDMKRAVLLARRHGLFATAIAQLGPDQRPLELALRRAWAESAAAAGNLLQACDALLAREETRGEALPQLERCVAAGGSLAGGALARLLQHELGEAEWARAHLHAALGLPPESALPLAVAFAEQAATGPASLSLRAPARRLVPFLARHSADIGWRRLQRLVPKLVDATGDPALRADMPLVFPIDRPQTHRPEGPAGAAGLVRDARTLPDGALLVACGAEGVRLLSPEGALLHHFACAADKLVLSDAGTRAIAVSRDDGLHCLTRLDLVSRREQPWWETSLDAFAPHFDGDRWMVASEGALLCIDACADGWEALARVPLDGQLVYWVEARGSSVAVLLDSGQEYTVLLYALEDWRCVGRPTFSTPVLALLPQPVVAHEEELLTHGAAFRFAIPPETEVRGVLRDDHRAVVWVTSPGATCFAVCEAGAAERWVGLALDVAARGMRLDGDFLTVWDAQGRVHSLHLPTASLAASLPIERR